jgi:hypothetical protein
MVGIALAFGACGGDEGGGESGTGDDPAQALKDIVAKTEAAGTARMTLEMAISGPEDAKYSGEGIVDFENERDLLTLEAEGQTVQLFNDAGEEYVRVGTSGRYQEVPESQQTPVANNPADSLKYVGTDVVNVKESGDGCYEGALDFKRILERADADRRDEFPQELRGLKAPVTVCADGEGRMTRYDVNLEAGGAKVELRSKVSDHGTAPALEALGPDERPQ